MTYVWVARRFRIWTLMPHSAIEPGSDLWVFLDELDPRYVNGH